MAGAIQLSKVEMAPTFQQEEEELKPFPHFTCITTDKAVTSG